MIYKDDLFMVTVKDDLFMVTVEDDLLKYQSVIPCYADLFRAPTTCDVN